MAWQSGGKGTFLQKALQDAVVSALGIANFGKSLKGKGKHAKKDKESKGTGKVSGSFQCLLIG